MYRVKHPRHPKLFPLILSSLLSSISYTLHTMSDSSGSLLSASPGVESPIASSSTSFPPDDDITPFPSPVLSAQSMAGLSRESASCASLILVTSNGDLEPEVDENRIVTDEDRAQALEVKARANKAFAGGSTIRLN